MDELSVCIIEPDADSREVLLLALEVLGQSRSVSVTAHSQAGGGEAIPRATVALVSVRSGATHPLALLTRLASAGATRVVAVAYDASNEEIHDCLKAGACEFLRLPVDFEALIHVLDGLLERSAAKGPTCS